MLKLLQKRISAIIIVSLVLVISIAFSVIYLTFRAAILNEAEKALTKALTEYTPARTAFLPSLPVSDDFSVSVEIYSKPPDDKNILFKTADLSDGSTIIAKCDITAENKLLSRLMISLALSGGILTVLIFIISLAVSKKAINPVSESIKIQKQFVADISHELKTPLSAISANLDLLSLKGEQAKWLENIKFETDRMIRLTKNMLGLFSGSNTAEFSVIPLSEICKSSALSFEAVAFEKSIDIITDIRDGIFTYANRVQIEQLVSILIDNAVKYNHPGGFVKVSLKQKHLKALLTVENTGDPIPDSLAVFRRFYRIDESRSREGFGLGLSIAHKIVADHGGKIWVKSEKTNVFSVNLGLKKK